MEEQDDEVGIAMESSTTSSWSAAEGTLNQSVKVVEESEDAVYTAGPTSRLVLVSPSSSSPYTSSSSADHEPCELTVTFKQRHGHIHQIYVLSTARICEMYGQKEQDGDRDYVCTVRGGIISLTDDEDSADDASNVSQDISLEEDLTSGIINSNATSLLPSAIPALASAGGVEEEVFQSKNQSPEFFTSGKMDLSQPSDEILSLTRRDSEKVLFRSFTEASHGKAVEGSVIFEESLDHADWVECPHSPMKSSSSITDDEAEVDVTKSGFYFIDADSEAQQADHPQVRLFTDAIRDSGKNPMSLSLERGDMESSGHSSWQEAIEETTLQKGWTDATLPHPSRPERNSQETRKIEEPFESPWAQVDEFTDDFIGENLPKSGSCDFEVNEERDSSSLGATKSPTVEAVADTHDFSTQDAESCSLETLEQENWDEENRFSVGAPVYECEVGLVDADAWTSVTIRLLSIKTKSQVEIHRVVVTYIPGPPIQPPVISNGGPLQQGLGTSSLLAMLVPGILQMARGMSEPRIAKNISSSSAKKGTRGSDARPTNGEPSSISPILITAQDIALPQVKPIEHHIPPMVEKNLNGEVTDETSLHSNVEQFDSCGASSLGSIAHGDNQLSAGYDRGLPESALPRPVHLVSTGRGGKESEESFTVNKETGLLEAQQKEVRADELVQRLDRLEAICLRMESSLSAALENMDKRLKLLETGGPGRMTPALGQPIWGPGFDSGSFLSATSVYVPAAFPGPGTPSLMDAQVPFSMCSAVDVPVVESAAKGLSSTETPVYPSVVSGTAPPPSLSPAVPSWPLSTWPQNVSPDSSSHSSGLTASFISKSSVMNRSNGSLQGSEHPSIGGETYWESQLSDESESDISSESEQTSYADNCEDSACGCCPESLSSSPSKPAQLVDNALASALSAFSASFGAQKKGFRKEEEFYHGEEDSDEEDSFASEEQVPLVELDSFPCYYEKEEVVPGDTENVFMHGYEAIPLSIDKDAGDLSASKVILEDTFWSSEIGENQQINWQDEGLQTQEEKMFCALEDSVIQTGDGTATLESSSAVFIQVADQPSLGDSTTDDLFSVDFERVLQKGAIKETKQGDDVGAVLEGHVHDSQQNPFMQELLAGDANMRGTQVAWHQQSWTEEQAEIAKNVLSSYLAVRDFSKPPDFHEEMLLQEGLFPDEWNWFTSEFSPFSSLVEVRDLSEVLPIEKEPSVLQIEIVDMLDGISSHIAPSHLEPWSLLDDDLSRPVTTEQYGRDMYGQDWLGQKSQWSLLDEYPPDLITGDKHHPEGGSQDDTHENREPRSLLDEDISIPSGKVPDVDQDTNLLLPHTSIEDRLNLNDVIRSSPPSDKVPDQEANLFSSQTSLEDHLARNDVILSSTYVDMSRPHSSEATKSNAFEDEYRERLDVSQGSKKAPLVSLEESEEGDREDLDMSQSPSVSEPEGAHSLLFHLSL